MLTCLLTIVAKEKIKKKGGGTGRKTKETIMKKEWTEGVSSGKCAQTVKPGQREARRRLRTLQRQALALPAGNTLLTFMSCSAFSAAWAWLPLAPDSDPQGPLATCGKRAWLIRPVVSGGGIWLASAIGGLWTGAGKVLVCGALTNGGTRLGWERIWVKKTRHTTLNC